MKQLPLFVITPIAYLLICAIIAALMAYPLHLVFHESVSFSAFIYRIAMALMIASLSFLAQRLALGKIGWDNSKILKQIAQGFLYGALILGIHAAILVLLDIRVIDTANLQYNNLIRWTYKGLLTGFAIAIIEEPLFRGFLLGYLQSRTHKAIAIFISAFYFAALHFLTTAIRPEFGETHWHSGLFMIIDAVKNMADADLDTFLALYTAGAFLGYVRILFPMGLGYCIGLHAGWVFIIKTIRYMSSEGPTPLAKLWVSHYDGIIGYLSSAWISLVMLSLILYFNTGRGLNPAPLKLSTKNTKVTK